MQVKHETRDGKLFHIITAGTIQETIFNEGYEHKLGGYGCVQEASGKEFRNPKSEFGYYPSVERVSEMCVLLNEGVVEATNEALTNNLQKVKGTLKHWTSQPYPTPEKYWLPDEEVDATELEEMRESLEVLSASVTSDGYKDIVLEIKAILARIAQGDSSYPKLHSHLEETKDGHCNLAESEGCIMRHSFLSEPVTVDWIEEDASKPFTFRGKALMADRRNENNRRYRRKIIERALKESRRLAGRGKRLTIMDGHPKRGDTAVTPVVGKLSFGDISEDGWMSYEGMISNTSRGMDIQKLLRDKCIGDVSLRSRGRTAIVKMDGEPVEDVIDLHFKGLDLVTEGSEEGAGVEEILNAAWDGSFTESIHEREVFHGSPRNPFGSHCSYRFKGGAGGYSKSWTVHFSQINGGALTPAASGPIRGTVRRIAMIAAAMKPPCKVKESENMNARGGAKSPLPGTYPEKPSDYGLSSWLKPSDEKVDPKLATGFTCTDLNTIKRIAVAEIKRRIADRLKQQKKGATAEENEFFTELGEQLDLSNVNIGGEFVMGTTLEELKKDCPELVEAIRSEEKDKLNKEIIKLKEEKKDSKEKLEEAENKLKEAKEAGNVSVEDYKKLETEVLDLKAKDKLRDSKEVYLEKIKEAKLTAEMTEGLEEQCLGKKAEEMDEIIKTRIEFVQKIGKSETVGIVEKKEEKVDPEKEKERMDKDVDDAFGK